jgi:1,4-alpha-glucan branching enzyme
MRKMMDDLKLRISKVAGNAVGTARGSKNATAKRFLAQMARELVLFQASDWAFMIHNNSAADYARARLNRHYENVCALYKEAVKANPDTKLLKKLEQKNNLFPWIGECVLSTNH